MPSSVKNAGFLLSANLADPDARVGRRKRARLRAGEGLDGGEMSAEKAPRMKKDWQDDGARKATKLPTASDVGGDAEGKFARDENDGGAVGRKKQKRLSVLEAKKAKKAQKKVEGQRREHEAASQAVKGKAKDGKISKVAAELLENGKGTPLAEQQLLAVVAERITGAPEKELDCFDVFFELHANGSDIRTRTLALLSAIAVFRDLVPGYRIREPTEQEKALQRSKPVIALERYELGLLQKYRQLLPVLEAAMKKDPLSFAPALAMLVRQCSEFNYRQRLLSTAVKYASSPIASVRKEVSEGIRIMIEADNRLEASREVVLGIGRIAQSAAGNASRGREGVTALKEELVEVMLRLPIGKAETVALREALPDGEADDQVQKGIAEASITQTADQVERAESELLTEVFIVYLRILRQRQAHGRGLLASALTGLSRWGQQVNIELLLEILQELKGAVKDAVERSDELVALQGLNCSMLLLAGQGQALLTDCTWICDAFKTSLNLSTPSLYSTHSEGSKWPPPRCFSLEENNGNSNEVSQKVLINKNELNHSLEAESVPALVLRCLEAALRCPQVFGKASDAALASLVEQLLVLASNADAHVGLALAREAATLLRKHPRLHTLLEMEGGLFGAGGVTEHALTVVWHLQPLAFSFIPEVAKAARALRAAIPERFRRGSSIADLFPSRDGQAWLACEVSRCLGAGLNDKSLTPTASGLPSCAGPQHKQGSKIKPASFLSEAELRAVCGIPMD